MDWRENGVGERLPALQRCPRSRHTMPTWTLGLGRYGPPPQLGDDTVMWHARGLTRQQSLCSSSHRSVDALVHVIGPLLGSLLHPFARPSIHPPMHTCVHPARHPFTHPSVNGLHPLIHPSVNPSTHASIHWSVHASVCLAVNASVQPCIKWLMQPDVI